ncbi:MAG TPA: MazG family protein [Nakamurella sp.]|nr:MazG family protein [Nakamurella sp.]
MVDHVDPTDPGDPLHAARPAARPPTPDHGAGERLLDAVAVMDRLRAPGGCPWDAEQTHVSLLRYLIEECYELVDAVERGDPAAVREELGDVLLQVLFHARIADETPADQGGFDIDEVAGVLVDKLVRRHPHVFGGPGGAPGSVIDAAAENADREFSAADQQDRWDEFKRSERGRSRALAGVALGQPSAALAGKLGHRAAKFGLRVELPDGDSVGEQLFRIAYQAGAAGQDPESALRVVARRHAEALTLAEGPGDRLSDH